MKIKLDLPSARNVYKENTNTRLETNLALNALQAVT
jgi:hypothetical protein